MAEHLYHSLSAHHLLNEPVDGSQVLLLFTEMSS